MSAGLSKGLFIILKLAFPRARAGRERISPKVEAQSFYYPLSDASSHHLCCILFSRSKSLIAATFKERELHKCRNTGQRRQWHPTPVLLPGKSHGRRSLVGYSPWGLEESDTTEQLHFHFSLSCTGEGNGNPLQCSCLENPRDRGAWWAAVYGVAESDMTEVT